MITEAPRGAIWAADLYVFVSTLARSVGSSAVDFARYVFRDRPTGPDDCQTAQELRAYANSIKHREPGFASDLIAAIDRSEQK